MRPRRSDSRRPTNFTRQQIAILIVFAVVGISTLVLAGYLLLAGQSTSPSPTLAAQLSPLDQTHSSTGAATAVTATRPPGPAQNMPPLPANCAQAGTGYTQGTLRRVIDGSTIEVQDGETLLQVGYAGITVTQGEANAASPQVSPAILIARELLEGQPVVLVKDVSEQDSSGRLLRYVFSGSRFINFELVRQGLATVSANSPDRACGAFLRQAEQQARLEKLGAWKSTPVPTRTFVPLVTLDPNQNGCDCSIKYLCSDFKTHAAAQVCLNLCNDYSSKLDDDRDGIACEDLP